ncbi:down syndrome cell adhesion molecule-like protein [Trichonephila clavipes]|nr:down syndrome cell adhesion molecule-like protein [Trichonephila clavipes]
MGQRLSITCTVIKGDPPITLKWLRDEHALKKDGDIRIHNLADYSSTLLFDPVKPEHRANYTCVASNEAGSERHSAAMVIHDDFMRGRIIGKIEEGRKITDVAREFDIAHSVVSRLWKSFKTTGMCSRRHGGSRVRNESRFSLSSDCRRQLIWRESGTAYRPENIQEKDRYPTCSIMVCAGIMINGRTRLHVVANGTMTGQRYIDEVLLFHVGLFRGAVGDKFVFMDDNATCPRTLAVQDCLDSEGIQRLV